MAYSIVLRRLQSKKNQNLPQWHGVDIITRYTLKVIDNTTSLRTLGIITALEWLRNKSWVPDSFDGARAKFSNQPVSLGIWVGGSLTPNKLWLAKMTIISLRDFGSGYNEQLNSLGAIRILKYGHQLRDTQKNVVAEPAQILCCPACEEH